MLGPGPTLLDRRSKTTTVVVLSDNKFSPEALHHYQMFIMWSSYRMTQAMISKSLG
ncbi:hypothetical protein HanPSC8_Chr13g0587231 [Helianthus annuus]|nr:hypothetical protein HanPSC8_Chr13g0587231 [Helianthus annuus]